MIHGVLDLAGRNGGFLRRREQAYQPDQRDIQVPANLISQLGLRPGDEIEAEPKPGGRPALGRLLKVNGRPPERLRERPAFERLTAIRPNEAPKIDCQLIRRGQPDQTNRVIDLMCPLGKGRPRGDGHRVPRRKVGR